MVTLCPPSRSGSGWVEWVPPGRGGFFIIGPKHQKKCIDPEIDPKAFPSAPSPPWRSPLGGPMSPPGGGGSSTSTETDRRPPSLAAAGQRKPGAEAINTVVQQAEWFAEAVVSPRCLNVALLHAVARWAPSRAPPPRKPPESQAGGLVEYPAVSSRGSLLSGPCSSVDIARRHLCIT